MTSGASTNHGGLTGSIEPDKAPPVTPAPDSPEVPAGRPAEVPPQPNPTPDLPGQPPDYPGTPTPMQNLEMHG
jgi:hypothetical protein